MNAINRIITFLLFLIAFLLFIILAAAPFETLSWMQLQLAAFSHWASSFRATNQLFFNLGRIGLAAAAIIILLPLMLAEFPSKKEAAVKMRTKNGEIRITAESIAKRLAWHLDQLADVITVTPLVTPRGDAVNVRMTVETSPEIDVPMKTEEIMLVTREIIEKDMGLKLGKLAVDLRHAAYPEDL